MLKNHLQKWLFKNGDLRIVNLLPTNNGLIQLLKKEKGILITCGCLSDRMNVFLKAFIKNQMLNFVCIIQNHDQGTIQSGRSWIRIFQKSNIFIFRIEFVHARTKEHLVAWGERIQSQHSFE